MIKKILIILASIILATTALSAKGQAPEDTYENGESLLNPGIYAKINTSKGLMIFQLDYTNAPLAVINFIGLAEDNFYDGLQVYKDIENYAIFSGDPLNDGSSDAGYNFPMENNKNIKHDKPGILTMDAVSEMSNGSRFFISKTTDSVLDEKYTAFGEILEGNSVLSKLKREMVINSIEIVRTGDDAIAFITDKEAFSKQSSIVMSSQLDSFREENPEVVSAIDALGDGVQKTLTGIYYKIFTEGNGISSESGDLVTVHYTGKFLDGTVFDSSVTRGTPFEFAVGTNSVITGWDESVMAMTIGEKRTVLIPPTLAYGNVKQGPIPANSWLIFEIEVLGIK